MKRPAADDSGAAWWLHAAALAAVVLFAYRDVVDQVARADQLIYLHRTAWYGSLHELTVGAYAMNRSDSIGDFLLFRPALYFLLGLERWAFGYDFRAWQATSLGLHLAVVLSLHRYLWTLLAPVRWLALPFALFFGLLYSATEMVAWDHVGGYLLFCLCVVLGARAAWRCIEAASAASAAGALAAAALAALTYELGCLFSAVLGIWLLAAARRAGAGRPLLLRTAGLLFLVPVIYVSWSAADYLSRFEAAALPGQAADPVHVVWGFGALLSSWAWTSLMPSALNLVPGNRIRMVMPEGYYDPLVQLNTMLLVAAAAALAGMLMQRIARRELEAVRNVVPAAAFVVLMLAYAAIIALGRGTERGFSDVLQHNTYYPYPFVLFGVMATGHLLAGFDFTLHSVAGRLRLAILALVPLVCAGLGAARISALHQSMHDYFSAPRLDLVARIEELHREHGGEQGFSFSVAASCKGDELPMRFAPYAKVPLPEYRLSSVLYPFTWRAGNGRYTVDCAMPAGDRIKP